MTVYGGREEAEDQDRTPLFSLLRAHASRRPVQFHIPGHKAGRGMDPEFREYVGDPTLGIDLINIAPLDDLHHPVGRIDEAQRLAARAFHADYSFFSVQGTSGAIMTMILSSVGPGDEILLPRNIHKSVLSAVILSGARPYFLQPEVDPLLGIAHGVRAEDVRDALDRHPGIRAVLLINPTYFGVAADLRKIAEFAHARGVLVLVDEAHGAHTSFHPALPLSAMEAGCDLAATSMHKLGGSLTQSAILHVREGLIRARHVHAILSMLTTTSTSYLLLASLDAARRQLATRGRELLDRAITLAEDARLRLNEIPGVYCPGREILQSSATYALDPLKLTIRVAGLGLSGYEAENRLRDEFNIEVELSDLYNVLCIVSFGDRQEDIDRLVEAVAAIAKDALRRGGEPSRILASSTPVLAMNPRDAFYSKTEIVSLRMAVGRTIADMIMVYPPGIPILLPGEIVTLDNVLYIEENLKAGLPVQGPDDPTIATVRVVAEEHISG